MSCFKYLYHKFRLRNKTLENTPKFKHAITYAKVIKVYDGDTITIAASEHNVISKYVVRLNGIDTPEIKTKDKKEKELGIRARDALSERIMGKIIRLQNIQNEKYGRILADVYLGSENMSEWLISEGYADAYDGKTKQKEFLKVSV